MHNATIDVIQAHRGAGGTSGGSKGIPAGGGVNPAVLLVQNVSGVQLPRYNAVRVTDSTTRPDASAANEIEFKNNVVLKVDVPTEATVGRWLVVLEDLADQQIGVACAAGAVQCRINLLAVGDVNVDVEGGSFIPRSGTSGFQILWVKGGAGSAEETGEQWAVIRLPGGGDLPTGQIQHQLYGMVTQHGAGWGLPLAVPDLVEVAT
jgi:hypothetical protein